MDMPMAGTVIRRWAGGCGLAVANVFGCIGPGEIDSTQLTRYQQAVLARPAGRAGQSGLDLLRHRPVGPELPLKITEDPKTRTPLVHLSLDEAVRLALTNSAEIRIVGFDPAITREEEARAAAAFDAVIFGNVNLSKDDHKTPSSLFGTQIDTRLWELGVRRLGTYGTAAELKWTLSRTAQNSPFTMSPAYESAMALEVAQPLLRKGGQEYNLAALHLARVNNEITCAQFRQKVEEVVAAVRGAYWALVQARRDVEIQEALLGETQETYKLVHARREKDATIVETSQALAAVETRRAALIQARKLAGDVQDTLARRLADKRVDLLGPCAIVPVSPPVEDKVSVNAADQLELAMRHSPILDQARGAIEAARVRVRVARNETLPVLNLVASMALRGLRGGMENAIEEMNSYHYIDRAVALQFEYPPGNRAARATLRQRTYERLKAVAQMQDTADQVALAVRESIRRIDASFEQLTAQRASVKATADQVRGLDDTLRIRGRLTPEFLQVKLAAQQALAEARRAEIAALIDYNSALAQLAFITGTTLQQVSVNLDELPARP